MSHKILVAYASVSGSTGEVAEAIGAELGQEDISVEVRRANDLTGIDQYSAVVLGSSIRGGRWLPEALQFLERYSNAMSRVPVAYFTTCLIVVQNTAESRKAALAYMEPIRIMAPEIEPVGLGLFAGSFDPSRLALTMVRDDLFPQGDYRDWEAIKAWAREIRPELLKAPPPVKKRVVLREAMLSYTDLAGADLSQTDLYGAQLKGADLSEANLQGSNLGEARLVKASLRKANLTEATLNWAELKRADLSRASLINANLIGVDLSHANLAHANLSQATLNGAYLNYANLIGADLSHTDLNWANLSGADLSRANLSYANLGWANLSDVILDQANLNQAKYNHQTQWPEGFSAEAHGGILVSGELH